MLSLEYLLLNTVPGAETGRKVTSMRQAVVVIHGIGEQKPMDTVRAFVDAVMPLPSNPVKPKFWSKPNPMSALFELRKLVTPQSRTMPPTDFYEYYWAYQARGTKFVHVISWAWILLVRRPKNVPHHLKVLWLTLWFLILSTATLISTGYGGGLVTLGGKAISANQLLTILSSALLLVISGLILNYVGDAARYLNPSPPNIDMRRRIRAEGVELLRELHKCEQYDRVILVGHSLGSVIAYDIVRNLWPEYNTVHAKLPGIDQKALHELESDGKALAANPTPELADKFRNEQSALWIEQRKQGNSWLVTDLITVGSPLAHAELLLARTKDELRERQTEREFPTCPPVPDEGLYSYPLTYDVNGQQRTFYALHHGAVFASTRWTNIYFPAGLGFFGDLVGGPLGEIFGHGVRDVPVDSAEWSGWLKRFPMIHTHYWSKDTVLQGSHDSPTAWALEILRKTLDLESRTWLREAEPNQKQP